MKNLTVRPINTGYVSDLSPPVPLPPFGGPLPEGHSEGEGAASRVHLPRRGAGTNCCSSTRAWLGRNGRTNTITPAPWQDPDLAIHKQLEKLGYKPEDIGVVVFTHLHWDHMFYMEKFTKARYFVHQREWAFAKDPIPLLLQNPMSIRPWGSPLPSPAAKTGSSRSPANPRSCRECGSSNPSATPPATCPSRSIRRTGATSAPATRSSSWAT